MAILLKFQYMKFAIGWYLKEISFYFYFIKSFFKNKNKYGILSNVFLLL